MYTQLFPLVMVDWGVSESQLSSSWVKMLGRKKSIIQIPRDEHDMCCARAIVVAVAQLNREPARKQKTPWHEKVHRYTSIQVRLAKELLTEAGIGADEPCGLPEREKFQSVLSKKGFSLVVVSRHSFNTIVYHGGDGKLVCLYLADNHYSAITRLPAFLGAHYVCGQCFGCSRSAAHHRCKLSCEFCGGKTTCRWEGDGELSSVCGITFRNPACLAGHVVVYVTSEQHAQSAASGTRKSWPALWKVCTHVDTATAPCAMPSCPRVTSVLCSQRRHARMNSRSDHMCFTILKA